MKFITYTLILSVLAWPVTTAHATSQQQSSSSSTSSSTSTGTCTGSGPVYGGGSFQACSRNDTQENSQSNTKEMNDSGAQQSMMLGMMATAAGAGMVAAGMATTPPNAGLIAAGTALIVAGMLGMQAAGNMANNAGIADYNDWRHNPIAPTTPITPGTTIGEKPTTPGIKIDPDFTRTGKSGIVFDEFEKKTGIDRNAFVDGLQNGRSAASMLAGAKGVKASEDKLADMINNAATSGSPMSADEVMGKLGLTPEELAALAAKNGANGEDSAYALNGGAGGASRGPASANGLDGLFGGGPGTGQPGDGVVGALGAAGAGLSPEIQAALDKNGITNLTIFQMVSQRYKTKTPMMFGEAARKPASAADNPFSNLGGGGKVDF